MFDRDHIEFIQAQMIPWRRIGPGLARPDAEYKFLSRDPADGACTALIRYPPGWRREGPEFITAAEEFYVLDGHFQINELDYGPDTYGYLPAGWTRHAMASPRGAVVLTMFDREPQLVNGEGPQTDEMMQQAIPRLDVLHMPWDMTLNDPKLAHLGISRKDLRKDPVTGERTFLSMVLPHSEPPGSKGPQERHPVVEEAYVVAGSLVGPQGEMEAGGYFWRPPLIPHGPYGTRWGCVSLIRFLGGQHVNEWSEAEATFNFDAPYDPVLPDELKPFAQSGYKSGPRY